MYTLYTLLSLLLALGHASSPNLTQPGWNVSDYTGQTTKLVDPGISFDFPLGQSWALQGVIALTTKPGNTPVLSGASSITAAYTITTTGAPIFNYDTEAWNDCISPAHARIVLFAPQYWDAKQPEMPYLRWWANPTALELNGAGSFSMTVSLDPSEWSSVYGAFGNQDATTLQHFNQTLANPLMVGLAFGGGCFFGHGVYVTNGTARFTLTQFTVNL